MASASLTITGMTCDHCRKTVEAALKEVEGTLGATVFLEDGAAEVEYDPNRASLDRYLRAVEAAGYGAKIAD